MEIFENEKWFQELKKVADQMNVEILNCSKRTTALNVFPKIKTEVI